MSKSPDWRELSSEARRAQKNAYAPYSSVTVGAAVSADDKVFSGCNVENASYPVGICAERGALAAAVAAGCRTITALAIAADSPLLPCGMCRQALSEFNPALPILIVGREEERMTSLDQLFPEPFSI